MHYFVIGAILIYAILEPYTTGKVIGHVAVATAEVGNSFAERRQHEREKIIKEESERIAALTIIQKNKEIVPEVQPQAQPQAQQKQPEVVEAEPEVIEVQPDPSNSEVQVETIKYKTGTFKVSKLHGKVISIKRVNV
jgi:hypothetical protein